MSDVKMNNSEYKIMDILWDRSPPRQPPLTAKEITQEAQRRYGWNKNTTYTVLNGLVKKEMVLREEPNFHCTAKISRAQAQKQETHTLIDKLFKGSVKLFFSSFLEEETLTPQEIQELEEIIQKKKG